MISLTRIVDIPYIGAPELAALNDAAEACR